MENFTMKELVSVGEYQCLFMKEVVSMCWMLGSLMISYSFFFDGHTFKPGPTQDFVKSEVSEMLIYSSLDKLLILTNIYEEMLHITIVSKSWYN